MTVECKAADDHGMKTQHVGDQHLRHRESLLTIPYYYFFKQIHHSISFYKILHKCCFPGSSSLSLKRQKTKVFSARSRATDNQCLPWNISGLPCRSPFQIEHQWKHLFLLIREDLKWNETDYSDSNIIWCVYNDIIYV